MFAPRDSKWRFYTLFSDTVTNDNCWALKRLRIVATLLDSHTKEMHFRKVLADFAVFD